MPIGTKLFPLRLFAPNGTASFPLCNFSLLNELRFCKKTQKRGAPLFSIFSTKDGNFGHLVTE